MEYFRFFYGLAFFSLGLIVGLETLRPIMPEVKPAFRSLAVFGILYGSHQWLQFFADVGLLDMSSFVVVIADMAIFLIATLFLALFGALLITKRWTIVTAVPVLLILFWLFVVVGNLGANDGPHDIHHIADNFGRYIIVFPAYLIAAWGVLRGRLMTQLDTSGGADVDRLILAVLLGINAFASGLVGEPSSLVSSNWLNDNTFLSVTGIPIELTRTLLAIGITVLMVAKLRVFEYMFLDERRAKEAMERDAEIAAEIQNELVPEKPLIDPEVQVYARLVQARIVGGDAFDYFENDERVTFMVADASGKGSPAALLSTAGLITLETEFLGAKEPSHILDEANKRLTKRFPVGSFMTASLGQYLPDTRRIVLASSGQNPPLVYRRQQREWRVVDLPGSLPLGIEEDAKSAQIEIDVDEGDRFLMYTDGLIDMRDEDGQKIHFEQILNWLNAQADLGPADLLDHLVDMVLSISGSTLYDDVTVLLVNIEKISQAQVKKIA